MSKIVVDVSMSLDGFVAGPNVRESEPMGDGGEGLHAWMGGDGPEGEIDARVKREVDARVGATIVGRRTFDLGLGPWGGTPWPGIPSFVVTHRGGEDLVGKNGGTFAFVDLHTAGRRAREVASAAGKDVMVLGPEIVRQLLKENLLDEISLHIAPVLLGGGTPMFDGKTRRELIAEGKPVVGRAIHLRLLVARP